MRTIAGVSELETLVGAELGTSGWLTVEQGHIDAFADATGDHQWIHVDAERAAASGFGATVAHGLLTLSLIPQLSRKAYAIAGISKTVNYGFNRVRFPARVSPGARIRDRAHLLSVVASPAGTMVTIRHEIELDGSDKPACVAETLTLVSPESHA